MSGFATLRLDRLLHNFGRKPPAMILAAVFLTGCGHSTEPTTNQADIVTITSPGELNKNVGRRVQITGEVLLAKLPQIDCGKWTVRCAGNCRASTPARKSR